MKLKWIVPVELGPTIADTRRIVVMAETKGQALLAAVDKLSAGERERAYIAEANIELATKEPKPDAMSKTQKRILIVLSRLTLLVEKGQVHSETLSNALNGMLDDLKGEDFFGTEAQLDPRGDGREGNFTMDKIQL